MTLEQEQEIVNIESQAREGLGIDYTMAQLVRKLATMVYDERNKNQATDDPAAKYELKSSDKAGSGDGSC